MPRGAMSPYAKAARALSGRRAELTRLHADFSELFRLYRAVKGSGLAAHRQAADIAEQIGGLFDHVEAADFELIVFARRGLSPCPQNGTAEAADFDEFMAIALEIARRNSRLPLARKH